MKTEIVVINKILISSGKRQEDILSPVILKGFMDEIIDVK